MIKIIKDKTLYLSIIWEKVEEYTIFNIYNNINYILNCNIYNRLMSNIKINTKKKFTNRYVEQMIK